MKQRYLYSIIIWVAVLCLAACQTDVKYVDPTWTRQIYPSEGATVKIDFFKPDQIQAFTWEVRKNSTYKVYIDTDMHFEDSYQFDMGTTDSLKISNKDLLEILRTVWPDFGSIKRFFWKVEQTTNGNQVTSSWRYFNAILSVESFVDERDNESYEARQYVMADGSLMTIMAENLRSTIYANGDALPIPAKFANSADPIYNRKAGSYYTWASVVNMSWDEAKEKTLAKESIQGICPDGWHVPSYDEFDKLRQYMGLYDGANKVKDPSYWKRTSTVTNSEKLNIIASGYYWHEGVAFISQGLDDDLPFAGLWSSTPYLKGLQYAWGEVALDDNKGKASLMSLYDDVEGIYLQGYATVPTVENRCYPVRCIMDEIK